MLTDFQSCEKQVLMIFVNVLNAVKEKQVLGVLPLEVP